MRGGRVSRFLCIEKTGESYLYLLKLGTLQGELVENEHSKISTQMILATASIFAMFVLYQFPLKCTKF